MRLHPGKVTRKVPIWLFALPYLIILLTGCSAMEGPAHIVASTNDPAGILYSDDFSHVPSGWGTWESERAVVGYEQGALRILVNQPDFDFWSVSGRKFDDVVIEVDATRRSGPSDNDFGLICRYRDAENFYMFLVSSDGYYGIAKLKNNEHSLIGIEQLQYSEQIETQPDQYRLRADCVDDHLSLFVNEQLMMETRDGDFRAGDVGVLAGAYSTPGVEILFDNFEVRLP